MANFTGELELIGDISPNTDFTGLLYVDGKYYTARSSDDALYEINLPVGTNATRVNADSAADDFGLGLTSSKTFAYDGTTTYMIDAGADALFSVDLSTGIASRIGSATEFGVSETSMIGMAWDGTTMYCVGLSTLKLYTLNLSTGIASVVDSTVDNFELSGPDNLSPRDLVWDGEKMYVFSSWPEHRIGMYEIDRVSGEIIERVHISNWRQSHAITNPFGAAWDGYDLFFLDGAGDEIFRVRQNWDFTGEAERVGDSTAFGVGETSPQGLANIGNTLYMLGDNNDALYEVSTTTGVATQVGSAVRFGNQNLQGPRGLGAIGNTLYANIIDRLYQLNTTTGIATRIGTAVDWYSMGSDFSADMDGFGELNGLLYAVRSQRSHTNPSLRDIFGVISRIDTSTGQIGPSSTADEFGVDERFGGISGRNGVMYLAGTLTDNLYAVSTAIFNTQGQMVGTAQRIGNVEDFGVSETGPRGLSFVGEDLYMTGGTNDALYKFIRLATPTIRSFSITDAGQTYNIPIRWNQTVTDFTASDITVTGATVGTLTGSGKNYVLPITVADSATDVEVTISIAANAVTGFRNTALSVMETARANLIPAVATIDVSSIRTAGAVYSIPITWDKDVTGFDNNDIVVTGATAGTLTGSGSNYVLPVSVGDSTLDVDITISIAENVVNETNSAATAMAVATANQVVVPIATIDVSGITAAGATYNIPITWDMRVTNFGNDDITVTGATAGTLTGSGTSYTLPITVASSLSDIGIAIEIAANAVDQGNTFTRATATATADQVPLPVATINVSSITTTGTTYQIPITWNQSVTGFNDDDITVTGATPSMLMGSGDNFSLSISVPDSLIDIDIIITIRENAVTAGNLLTRATAMATANLTPMMPVTPPEQTPTPITNINSYIFDLPHNFDKRVFDGANFNVTQVTDNNKLTFWSSRAAIPTLNFDISGITPTSPTTVDSIYLVGTNIASFTINVGADTMLTAPMSVVQNNLQYALYTVTTQHMGTTATLSIQKQVSTSPVTVHECMIMRELWHFPDASFSVIDLNKEKRGSIIQEALDYSTTRTIPMLNYQKHLLALEVSIMSIQDTQVFNGLTDRLTNFTFCREWPRWPEQVYTCHFRDDIASTYPSRFSSAGVRHSYVIQQS